MSRLERENAEHFAALVAHPYSTEIAWWLYRASRRFAWGSRCGRELLDIWRDMLDARARARWRA